MKPLLEKFRMFHSPLNEVTITSSTDPSQERSIEASITAPRDAQNTSFRELVLQLAELTKRVGGHVSNGTWVCAFVLSHMALSTMRNYHHPDNFVTPWSGKLQFSGPHGDFSTRRFELMMLVIPHLNFIFASIPGARELVYLEDADEAQDHIPGRDTLLDLTTLEFRAFAVLLHALQIIFDGRVEVEDSDVEEPDLEGSVEGDSDDAETNGDDPVGDETDGTEPVEDEEDAEVNEAEIVKQALDNTPGCWELVRLGLLLIEWIVGFYEHLPTQDQERFILAQKMAKHLRLCDQFALKSGMVHEVDKWRAKFAALISEQERPFKWAVHESLLPNALVARGVVEHMTDCSTMTTADKQKALVVNVFPHVDDNGEDIESDGVWYCV
jgi:hypothetical protein